MFLIIIAKVWAEKLDLMFRVSQMCVANIFRIHNMFGRNENFNKVNISALPVNQV